MSRRWRTFKWLATSIALFITAAVVVLFPSRQPFKYIAVNEVQALLRLRAIAESQTAYRTAHDGSFADDLNALGFPTETRGYVYSLRTVAKDPQGHIVRYVVTASPKIPEKTGFRYFSMDETGKIRFEVNRSVDEHSQLLQLQ